MQDPSKFPLFTLLLQFLNDSLLNAVFLTGKASCLQLSLGQVIYCRLGALLPDLLLDRVCLLGSQSGHWSPLRLFGFRLDLLNLVGLCEVSSDWLIKVFFKFV